MTWSGIILARELRKKQTTEEKKLWELLRNRRFNNLKFTRQRPIRFGAANEFYIADSYYSEKILAIELDGKIHLKSIQSDSSQDQIITEMGIIVIRIKNEELNNMELVIKIQEGQ